MSEQEALLTGREVAERLWVNVSTIDRWRFDGEGPPPIRLGGRTVRYDRSDVEAYIQAQRG